jgi:hypothetical protein
MATYDVQELQRLLNLPEEDLYIELYAQSDAGVGVLGSPGMKQQRGRKLFEKYRKQLRGLICERWRGCDKAKNFDDIIKLVGAMAALIAPSVPQISAVTAAVLIAKIGINVFCECEKKKEKS